MIVKPLEIDPARLAAFNWGQRADLEEVMESLSNGQELERRLWVRFMTAVFTGWTEADTRQLDDGDTLAIGQTLMRAAHQIQKFLADRQEAQPTEIADAIATPLASVENFVVTTPPLDPPRTFTRRPFEPLDVIPDKEP